MSNDDSWQDIAIIGSGYVGLVSGLCLARRGHRVVLHDSNPMRLNALAAGKVPFHEPGAQLLLEEMLAKKRVRVDATLAGTLADARFALCCVGTPRQADDSLSTQYVEKAARAVADVWRACPGRKCFFVIRSTVPPGTNARIARIFDAAFFSSDTLVHVVSNPEFLCLHGDTPISMPGDHRAGLPVRTPIADLVGRENFPVYTYDAAEQRFRIATAVRVWQTKVATELVALTLDDGTVLRCTPEHLVMSFDREWVPAEALIPGSRLLALHHRYDVLIKDVDGHWVRESRLVGAWLAGRNLPKSMHVDHVDPLRLDNRPEALRVLSAAEHNRKTHMGNVRSKPQKEARAASQRAWAQRNPEKFAEFTRRGALAAAAGFWTKFKSWPKAQQAAWLHERSLRGVATRRANGSASAAQAKAWATRRARYGASGGATGRPPDAKPRNHKVVAVERLVGEFPVYDMEVEGTHNFIGAGVVVHNSEGTALIDFDRSRVVVGALHPAASRAVRDLYPCAAVSFLCRPVEAELVKMAANTMLAIKVVFGNEIARLCEAPGIAADANRVLDAVGADARIGPWGFKPGPGALAGSCFAKDPYGLHAAALHEAGIHLPIVDGLLASDRVHRGMIFSRILSALRAARPGRHLCLWGLAFKGGTDDVRDGAPLDFLSRAALAGFKVRCWDPIVHPSVMTTLPAHMQKAATFTTTPIEAADGAGAIVVLTPWDGWRGIDPEFIAARNVDNGMPSGAPSGLPTVFDLRGALDVERWTAAGFRMHTIGRGDLNASRPSEETWATTPT